MCLVHETVNEEIKKSLELIKELEHVMNEIQSNESLFISNIQNMSLCDKQSILDKWISYVKCYNELNYIREKYKNKLLLKNVLDSDNKYKNVLLIYASTIAIRKNSVLLAGVIDKKDRKSVV